MTDAMAALRALDFGRVDSESEPDLEARFVRTQDFGRFIDERNLVIQGAKGSGKSALFEMFSKHLPTTRNLAGSAMDRVLIATGTGFGDLREVSTADIQAFQKETAFSYENVWRLYIALKAALALGEQGYTSTGPLRDFLRAAGTIKDYRIGPMMSSLWQAVAGNAPRELNANFMGSGVKIVSGKQSLDVLDVLEDVQSVLHANGKTLWLLFDKIDEIHSTDPAARKQALEGLFPVVMGVHRAFPRVIPRVFVRTDLYGPELAFTNKSHLVDKTFEITWKPEQLRVLLVKRGLTPAIVRDYAAETVPELTSTPVDALEPAALEAAYHVLFDERAYPGKREAKTLTWMIDRATDAKGGTFPREMINYGNASARGSGRSRTDHGPVNRAGLSDGFSDQVRDIPERVPRVAGALQAVPGSEGYAVHARRTPRAVRRARSKRGRGDRATARGRSRGSGGQQGHCGRRDVHYPEALSIRPGPANSGSTLGKPVPVVSVRSILI